MAILKRGKSRDFKDKFRESVWPSMGWRRTFRYYKHRMFRTGDSTRKIVAGLVTGMTVSCTPFLGTHVVATLFLCWILRLNSIAGFIGTALGNPSTYPFIFWLEYKVGVWVCRLFGLANFIALPDGVAFTHFIAHPLQFFQYMIAHPHKLLLPLVIGGCLCALVFWPLAYGALYYPVRSARRAYRMQRMRRFKKKQQQEQAP